MKTCSPEEISLKSYFLGPQAENAPFLLSTVLEVVRQYCHWRQSLFPGDGKAISAEDRQHSHFLRRQKDLSLLLESLSQEFQNEIPQFSPRYLGHMFSELSLPGLLGHLTALLHNPNNISRESSQVGLRIESKAIEALCQMFHWKAGAGHMTSGGTVANLEALLRMRNRIPPDQWSRARLFTSTAAHYSWKKNLRILGFPEAALVEVPLDRQGRLSVPDLAQIMRTNRDPWLGVVSLYGSTERGTVDDIAGIVKLLKSIRPQKPWHHVDAAYGGFFASVKSRPGSHLALQTKALSSVDSLTLNPHKLGYVPYGCGAFLCREKKNYFYSKVEAPYIQFQSAQEAGVQSVEGSRPATGAAATWLTAQSLGFHSQGMGKILGRHLKSKIEFQSRLKTEVKGILITDGLDLNILCWTRTPRNRSLSTANQWVERIFKEICQGENPFFVSKTTLPLAQNKWLQSQLKESKFRIDAESCQLIRMTLMNPFLRTRESKIDWMEQFLERVNRIRDPSRIPRSPRK